MQKNIRKLLSIGLTAAALAVSTFASASTDLSGKSWSEIEELAKKEGKLTVSVWYLQPQFRNFVKEFEQTEVFDHCLNISIKIRNQYKWKFLI